MRISKGGEEEVEVGGQERNMCLTEIPGKFFKQMIDLKATDSDEKMDEEEVEHNMRTEANEEVDDTGGEGEKDDVRNGPLLTGLAGGVGGWLLSQKVAAPVPLFPKLIGTSMHRNRDPIGTQFFMK